MIGIYIRVSSHTQKSESQRAEIQQWLALSGCDSDSVLWFEDKESGATLQRRAFQRLQQAVFRGEVKTVVVWKLDRLARSMREGVNVLTDWCERGVRVVSVTQQIDLSSTIGHLVAGVLFAIAEIELQHMGTQHLLSRDVTIIGTQSAIRCNLGDYEVKEGKEKMVNFPQLNQ